jgi:hypothetical protein
MCRIKGARDQKLGLCRRGGIRSGLGRVFTSGGENGMQDGSLHAGHELDHAGSANVLNQTVNDLIPEIAVGHLASSETQACLHLVALGEKADSLILFGLVIVLVHRNRELDFLDRNHLLALSSSAFALLFLIQKTAIVLNPANRWDGGGGNFNQVEATFAGNTESLKGLENAKLFAVFVDDADFARANPIVDANEGLCRSFIECDGTPPKACRTGRDRTPRWAAEQRRNLSITLARPSEKRG